MKDKLMFGITAIAISAAILALGGKKEKAVEENPVHYPYAKR